MIHSIRGTRGMAVAPHALAAQSALDVLREGGNALEAMIAAAATIAVAYPHMNGIGGDSFWLYCAPRRPPPPGGTPRAASCARFRSAAGPPSIRSPARSPAGISPSPARANGAG